MELSKFFYHLGHSSPAILASFHLAIISFALFLPACTAGADTPPRFPAPDGGELDGEVSNIAFVFPGESQESRAWSWSLMQRMDLFIFDDSPSEYLDCYRHFDEGRDAVTIRTSSGAKSAFVVANYAFPDSIVRKINTFKDLSKVCASLTEEDPSTPVMTGKGAFEAGEGPVCRINLAPLMSRVEIRSLRVARSDQTVLKDVKVYLTGVSSRCPITGETPFLPSEIINHDGLNEKDMARMSRPSLVYRYLGNGRSDENWVEFGSATLYCYPNETDEESAGSPFTRLVIEGKGSDGRTQYYVIPVNRKGYGYGSGREGIGSASCYSMKIDLTKEGKSEVTSDLPPFP